MDLQEFKKQYVQQELGINESFGNIHVFIDFGNVNHWFEEDRQDHENNPLKDSEKLGINLRKLKEFADLFSRDSRFYYGHDRQNLKSFGFIRVARDIFGKYRVFTKQIQKIRHYLNSEELSFNTRNIHEDKEGKYILIPKCNFDVEITVDAIKYSDRYDTFCLFSSDADFVHLARFLKTKDKKVVLIKGGYIISQLRKEADLIINAQNIKKHIAEIKQRPGH